MQGVRREVRALSRSPQATLAVPPLVLGEVFARAAAAYPAESCGLLLGPRAADAVDEVRPCRNVAGPGAFALDLPDLCFLEESLRGARPARILYHSHADGPPALSPQDVHGILLGSTTPAWPLAHLVVEVRCGVARAAVLHRFDPCRGGLVPCARYAAAPPGPGGAPAARPHTIAAR